MSLSAEIQQQFLMASANDPSFQRPMTQAIELETFSQILNPIKEFLDHDPLYGNYEMSISRQMEEMRKMCLEAYAAHKAQNDDMREGRVSLLNALQSLQESIQDAENQNTDFSNKFVIIQKEDRDALSALTEVVQEASEIHGGFLHNYNVAVTLEKTVETLNDAANNCFLPKTQADLESFMQNSTIFTDFDLPFEKAASGLSAEVTQVAEPDALAENDAEYKHNEIA